jgi:hypothetical protein
VSDFIELNRLFAELDPKSIGERDDASRSMASLFFRPKTWSDVLSNRCTVIISEAGTGKTEELRNRAIAIRAQGKDALFCRLDLLANSPFQDCIDVGTKDDFNAWLASDGPGYFFLDSVDEARLANPKDFEAALLKFIAAVQHHLSRATAVISTRASAWQALADPVMLATRFGVAIPETDPTAQTDDGDDEDSHDAGDTVTSNPTVAAPTPAPPKLSIVQMAPLNEDQVRIFATARGVADVDQFMDAVERADADLYASRPADLQGLVQLWKDKKRIGGYREVVESNITNKLREENPAHQQKCIDDKKALQGAQRLAAAVTLTRKSSIRLPQTPSNPAAEQVSLDAMSVLADWRPEEVKDLLGRALFDESLYGTVRFHHRTAREYLTAKWLARLLDRRKSRRAVQSLLFAKPYGTLPEAAVPSMKPIVGWLALDDQQIRDKAIEIDPKILLEFGDASSLDIDTRASLLKTFARMYTDRQHTPLSLHLREVRRLGDPKLSVVISDMLQEYSQHEDVRQLLLRLVREGRIENCGAAVLPFVMATNIDPYSQSYAVQAIGIAGTIAQRNAVKSAILVRPDKFNRQVLAAVVETIGDLSCDDVARIVEGATSAKPFASDQFDSELERHADRLSLGDKKRFLGLLLSLIERPPLKDENYCRVSTRFAWLLPLAFDLAKQILKLEPDNRDTILLTTLSMAEQSDHIQGYHGDIQKELSALLDASRTLKHAIFWHEVDSKRIRSRQRVTDFWHPGINMTSAEDFPLLCSALKSRPGEDKLVALSALMRIYGLLGRPGKLLDQLRTCVAGDPVLEAALAAHLSPPTPSSVVMDAEREHRRYERKFRLQQEERDKDRRQWIERLKANPATVGDLSIAANGQIWNNTRWLFDEIRDNKKSNSRWTTADWQVLDADFGESVARAFRDYCIGCWRLYEPKLRSEAPQITNQTPFAVIVGLSGLAMEFRLNPSLPESLSDEEVKRAVRYALEELNEMPSWLWPLYRARPQPVTEVLVSEMTWELDTPHVQSSAGYILSRLRWSSTDLGVALRPHIVDLILTSDGNNPHALLEALIVVLRDPKPVPASLIDHARASLESAPTEELKALWLAFLICVDAVFGVEKLEQWIKAASTLELKESRMTFVLNNVWGGRFDGFNTPHKDYQQPHLLLRLLKLAHSHIRIEDDLVHEGGYSPGARDHAQEARSHLLELLYKIPGRVTYDALVELSRFHTSQYPKDRTLSLAEERAGLDLEHPDWRAEDIDAFAADAERAPRSQQQLFDLAVSRLDDLKLTLEEGDESEASLLRKVEDEYELRRAIASRLRDSARQRYDVGSEEELADKSRTDIRLHNPDVTERVPIELKLAGKWKSDKLRERLENQLTKQYMLEAKYGVFVVVNRAAHIDTKSWSIGGLRVGFADLVEWLKAEASQLVAKSATVEAITIVGIDLTLRDKEAVAAAKDRAKKKSAKAKKDDRKRSAAKKNPGRKSKKPKNSKAKRK